jgi:lipopolysaccharide transport system permease protein
VYSLNPMVGVIEGFRWAILGGEFVIPWPGFLLSLVLVGLLLAGGLWYFRRTEQRLVDVL